MDTRKLCLAALVLTGLGVSGCASVTVSVDVYGEELATESRLTGERVVAIQHAAEGTPDIVDRIIASREKAGANVLRLYRQYLQLQAAVNRQYGGATTNVDAALQALDGPKTAYGEELRRWGDAAKAQAQRVLTAVAQLDGTAGGQVPPPDDPGQREEILKLEIRGLQNILQHLQTGNLGTVFEEMTAEALQDFERDLTDVIARWKAQPPQGKQDTADLTAQITDFVSVLQKIRAEADPQQLPESVHLRRIDDLIAALGKAPKRHTSVAGLQKIAQTLPDALALAGTTVLDAETYQRIRDISALHSFCLSQWERLQDPADPAWRALSDAKNECHWHRRFVETEFYAEGNSEVVFVQDQVGHFRVQRGRNNPTALIQGQMKINRAIASGALDVLAASGGVRGIPGLSKVSEAPSVAPSTPAAPTEGATAQAQKEADVEAQSAATTKALRAFAEKLGRLRAEVATKTPAGRAISSETRAQLRETIRIYQALVFQPLAEKGE